MHRIEGTVILSPTDLVGNLDCEHLTQLELAVTRGELTRPDRSDPELDLLRKRGELHERGYLEELRRTHPRVVEIGDYPETIAGLRDAAGATLEAMRAGADVIYQAAFFDGRWRGRADFLTRVPTPSELGDWSYEVADTKLARSVKVAALLQMCEYSLQLSRLQGVLPRYMTVVLGDGTHERHAVADVDAYHRNARRRLEAIVDGERIDTYPEPVRHCDMCRWLDRCRAQRHADDHLSLVAGMRRDHTRRLVRAGISTVAALAAAPAECAADIGEAPWRRLRVQARLQVHERTTGEQTYELMPCDDARLGLGALPSPSPGDLFFDMEGDPFAQEGGLEYLFGITEVVDGAPVFHDFWAHDAAAEKAAFEHLVDFIIDRLDRDPSLHVYHYASYEASALKRLMSRHATREIEVDRLLRGGVLVDLYRAVVQGVRVSKDSYSLKALEAYFMPPRAEAIADAAGSIVAYEKWRETREQRLLDDIAAYNARDCESTWRLRDWLEGLRGELELRDGREVPRPAASAPDASEAVQQDDDETAALVGALTAGLPDEPADRDAEQGGRWLLAQLLGWHRREEKSEWWAYYDRLQRTDAELVDDRDAIGDIVHTGTVETPDEDVVERYTFDPTQDYKLSAGSRAVDPRTQTSWQILALDAERGSIDLKRPARNPGGRHPTSLVPSGPYNTKTLRAALRRVAQHVVDDGAVGRGRYAAARDLLRAAAQRVAGHDPSAPLVPPGSDPVAETCRIVAALDDSCLAVQGPPGCGKTYTGAHVIVDQVRRGRRVGVCATTHRAVGQLLHEVVRVAGAAGVDVRVMQRCDPDDFCSAPGVLIAKKPEAVVAALADGEIDVVGGTAWLFSAPGMDAALDLVVIDEAGQMSLASALAVATAGRNLLLLGDPQQLAQPSRGLHPEGADVSALQQVLQKHDTIAAGQGVFLPLTRRMHPDVCRFVSTAFYDDRLESDPVCGDRRLSSSDAALSGTGLRVGVLPHMGNRTWSPEEVDAVADLVERLHSVDFVDGDMTRPLGLDDILVVAPYNAQVKRLRDRLPDARVGTVDKFQGQEAAVVIYSMATSSADDIPRNLDFLFSRNRLNVAVSRAQALAIVVCSPALLLVRCRTPDQLRLVNALCRFVEMATVIPA